MPKPLIITLKEGVDPVYGFQKAPASSDVSDFAISHLRRAHRKAIDGDLEEVVKSLDEWEGEQKNVDNHITRARKAAYLANFILISSNDNPNKRAELTRIVEEELPHIAPGPAYDEITAYLERIRPKS